LRIWIGKGKPSISQLRNLLLLYYVIHIRFERIWRMTNYNFWSIMWEILPTIIQPKILRLASSNVIPSQHCCLTRVLQALCRHIISGLCCWYVYDLMAVSLATMYLNDSTLVDSNVQQLLGQGSIATTKSQHDRCLEFLGWDFNLDTRPITLCARNMNKLVHALFSFHSTDKISISHIQRLASLISRASILSRHMRPYTHTLHSITRGYVYPHVKIHLSILAQSALGKLATLKVCCFMSVLTPLVD